MKVIISYYPPEEAEQMAQVDEALKNVFGYGVIRNEQSRRESEIKAVVYITPLHPAGIAAVKELKQRLREDKENGNRYGTSEP